MISDHWGKSFYCKTFKFWGLQLWKKQAPGQSRLKLRFWLTHVQITKKPHCKGIISQLLGVRKNMAWTSLQKGNLKLCADLLRLQMRHSTGPGKPARNLLLFHPKSVFCCCYEGSSTGSYNFKAANGRSGNHTKHVCDCQRGHRKVPRSFIPQSVCGEVQADTALLLL